MRPRCESVNSRGSLGGESEGRRERGEASYSRTGRERKEQRVQEEYVDVMQVVVAVIVGV